MKVLLVVALLVASVCAQEDTPVGETLVVDKPIVETLAKEKPLVEVDEKVLENTEIKPTPTEGETTSNDEVRAEEGQRIASGVDATVGENLDYVQLTIIFYNQMQTCGGILVHPQYVLTTASCVKDPVEGVASIVNATFPQKTTNNVMPKLQIFIHESYDEKTYANNVALIKLMNSSAPDNKTLAVANFSTLTGTDLFVNQTLRLCGFGSVANYYTKPTKMKCADLFIQPAANCSTLPNTICSFWTDRDANACNNDYGGALYLTSIVGTRLNQTVVGMASHSPDYRPNSPCFDGHKVVHVMASAYIPWAMNIISPGSAPAPVVTGP